MTSESKREQAKPVQELTAHDFQDHPIWEYAMDEEDAYDETYVRPVYSHAVPQKEWVVYQVACTVTVASGKSYSGFLEICNNAFHCGDGVPVVVGNSGSDYWWLGAEPDDKSERHKFEKFFGATYAQLLPIRWQLCVPVPGNSSLQSGIFEG